MAFDDNAICQGFTQVLKYAQHTDPPVQLEVHMAPCQRSAYVLLVEVVCACCRWEQAMQRRASEQHMENLQATASSMMVSLNVTAAKWSFQCVRGVLQHAAEARR